MNFLMENEKIIQGFIEHNEHIVSQFYYEYLDNFFTLGKGMGCNDILILEGIYHDALLVMLKDARNGKLSKIGYPIEKYFFGTCKNLIYEFFKNEKKDKSFLRKYKILLLEHEVEVLLKDDELTIQEKTLKNCILSQGVVCQKIIKYFFTRGLDVNEIAFKINYKNGRSVSVKKSNCLMKIRNCYYDRL